MPIDSAKSDRFKTRDRYAPSTRRPLTRHKSMRRSRQCHSFLTPLLSPVKVIPGCKIHFLRFEGTEEKVGREYNETLNMQPIEGPLPKQIDAIGKVLDDKISRSQRLGSDGKFHLKQEYPRDAWYEAIVNACVHRSYNYRNRKIFVKMFDDRLEFESPGPFPPGVTPDTIYEVQHSRNPFIMESMRYLGYVREVGEGTPRIRQEMLRSNLPAPEFSQPEVVAGATVRVRLRNKEPTPAQSGGSRAQSGGLVEQSGGFNDKVGGSEKTDYEDFNYSAAPPDDVLARLPELKGRLSPENMKLAILELCAWRPLMASEVAFHLHRKSAKSLAEKHIWPLFSQGLLERTIPDTPAHPAQKYKTTEEGLKLLFMGRS